jgi:hypothetical protein
MNHPAALRVFGVDFSSAPSAKKPITIAVGLLHLGPLPQFELERVELAPDWQQFEAFLQTPGPWIAGFDLPFGQPRPLIEHYGWPRDWTAFIRFFYEAPKDQLRASFKAWCDARPVGQKFAWRAADRPAGSSPAMRWTNPPVAWMMKEGAIRIHEAGLWAPAHQVPLGPTEAYAQWQAASARVALEAYPAYTARQVSRASYKSDTPASQTPERREVRREIVRALATADARWPQLKLTPRWRRALIDEPGADLLDAVICALQAGQAVLQPRFGLPDHLDPLEGWIATVPEAGPEVTTLQA